MKRIIRRLVVYALVLSMMCWLPVSSYSNVVSATDDLMSVSNSYREAVRTLDQKLVFGRNQVIRIHDIDKSAIVPGYLEKDYIEYILKYMKEGRIDLCVDKNGSKR